MAPGGVQNISIACVLARLLRFKRVICSGRAAAKQMLERSAADAQTAAGAALAEALPEVDAAPAGGTGRAGIPRGECILRFGI